MLRNFFRASRGTDFTELSRYVCARSLFFFFSCYSERQRHIWTWKTSLTWKPHGRFLSGTLNMLIRCEMFRQTFWHRSSFLSPSLLESWAGLSSSRWWSLPRGTKREKHKWILLQLCKSNYCPVFSLEITREKEGSLAEWWKRRGARCRTAFNLIASHWSHSALTRLKSSWKFFALERNIGNWGRRCICGIRFSPLCYIPSVCSRGAFEGRAVSGEQKKKPVQLL